MGQAKQYSGSGSFVSAQSIAEKWATEGHLAIVVRTDAGLYKASQWLPDKFIETFKRPQDEIEYASELNAEHGFPPPANLLSTRDMEIYFAEDTWLDENGGVCKGNPNNFVTTRYSNDIEAIQSYFNLSAIAN
jgi:hypothetical protein